MKKIEKKRNTEENPLDLREKGRETAQFFTISVVSKCFRATFFLILSASTIRLSADILIAFENFFIASTDSLIQGFAQEGLFLAPLYFKLDFNQFSRP